MEKLKNRIFGEQWVVSGQDVWIKNSKSSSAIYEHMLNHIRKKVKEELWMTKGRWYHIKVICWWNTEVQAVIKEKKMCF